MMSSAKMLRKALLSTMFDPRKPHQVMSIVVEGKDSAQLLDRGIEMLRQAKLFEGIERWAKVRDAVAVLAYSMTLYGDQ